MVTPDWIWFSFILAFGCCIGSFLNVVIYRLPREKSLVFPGSACPSCGHAIHFYDNIPLFSWIILGGKCRYCKATVSARYFVIELLTGLAFLGLFIAYYRTTLRQDLPPVTGGGWVILLLHWTLLGAFIAASAIDMELWIIPLSLCWFVTLVGAVAATVGPYFIESVEMFSDSSILPHASATTGALALGGGLGLICSLVLLATKVIKRSYEDIPEPVEGQTVQEQLEAEAHLNHRKESLRELVFLTPIVLGALLAHWITQQSTCKTKWEGWMEILAVSGFLGALWGYLIGCAIVWGTRILGTLAFGKEAMGLGDVHLMGAAGAVLGPVMVTVAFFVAPFFGLTWALIQMFSKKMRQIPYGPFLSMGTLVVMIFHDWILPRVSLFFVP